MFIPDKHISIPEIHLVKTKLSEAESSQIAIRK